MLYISQTAPAPEIEWSNPIGTLDVDESGDTFDLNLDFHFALPIVELLAMGVDEFSFSIGPGKAAHSYRYFSGDIRAMEEDILTFFKNQFSEPGTPEEEYASVFYEKYSLTKFISDSAISKMNSVKNSMSFRSSEFSYREISDAVRNEGDYLSVSSRQEPAVDLSKFPTWETDDSFKSYFRAVAGVYSLNPIDIARVEFVRNLTNESFKGLINSKNENRIPMGSSKYPEEFWSMWQKLFNWNMMTREQSVILNNYSSNMFPCRVLPKLSFLRTSRNILAGLFLRDTLKITIHFFSKGEQLEIEPIQQNINLLEMLQESAYALKAPEVNVIAMETYDRITISNPNNSSLMCTVNSIAWESENEKQIAGISNSVRVDPYSETYIDLSDAINFESRYYQVGSYCGFWKWQLDQAANSTSDDPSLQSPCVHVAASVPGVAKVVNPILSDPSIGCYHENSSTIKVALSDLPPYIDKVKYYLAATTQSGEGAKRPPGKSRKKYTYISSDPAAGTSIPTGRASISKSSLNYGNYEIIADLYSKGCVVDSIQTVFHLEPLVEAASHGVDFSLQVIPVPGTQGAQVKITETPGGNSWASSNDSETIINTLTEAGTLPDPLREPFAESWVSSKYMSAYNIYRFNYGNGTTELLGVLAGNDSATFPESEVTTPVHSYIAKQNVATVGQLISSISPTTTTETSAIQIRWDYAKFMSQNSLKYQTIPNMVYSDEFWPAEAVGMSSTGRYQSRTISNTENVSPRSTFMTATYDELRKLNRISWNMLWSSNVSPDAYPRYFLIKATYGGVTAPIGYAFSDSDNRVNFSISEKVLAGAMGVVTYSLFCIYLNGAVSEELARAEVAHNNDKNMHIVIGKGL